MTPIRAVYVSYDGALDPLGASQVIPYLRGLSERDVQLTLISFEKAENWRDLSNRTALQERLAALQIGWRPLSYHRSPRIPATAWDVWKGARAIRAAVATTKASIVHCRGDVTMTMARLSGVRTQLLYDVRAFFADQRAESGSWAKGGWLDRAVRKEEANNLARADAVVALTQTAIDVLSSRRFPFPPYRVIPTCVDVDRFRPAALSEGVYSVGYCGSLGGPYPTRSIVDFARLAARRLGAPALLMTRQMEEARRGGAVGTQFDLRSVSAAEVPAWIQKCRAAILFCTPGESLKAAFPTKFAEALASGIPVVVNRGIGDPEQIVEAERVGVVVEAFGADDYARALDRLATLLSDDGTRARCRALAESRFNVTSGIAAYHDLYRALTAS